MPAAAPPSAASSTPPQAPSFADALKSIRAMPATAMASSGVPPGGTQTKMRGSTSQPQQPQQSSAPPQQQRPAQQQSNLFSTNSRAYDAQASALLHSGGDMVSAAFSSLRSTVRGGRDIVLDLKALVDIAAQALKGPEPLDDRKLLLEETVALLASTAGTKVSTLIEHQLIDTLYHDLPHPASTLMRAPFRAADGSGNNPFLPDVGKARMPYARSAQRIESYDVLPDPALVFDMLLGRRGDFVPHPTEISSLLFAFATVIIHSIFDTSHDDPQVNNTSSYLDLSPVYGNNEAQLAQIRTKKDGLLFPDAICDGRMALMTPATTSLAILFSRQHNYIASQLKQIDEGQIVSSFTDEAKRDDYLFGTARLVNCASFAQIILRDYIPVILNLTGDQWYLDPAPDIRKVDGSRSDRAGGNHVAAEFSILYRWHSAASQEDEAWLEEGFAELFPGKQASEVTPAEFKASYPRLLEKLGKDPKQWQLHSWERDIDGKFDDGTLAETLFSATENVAGAIRARGSPQWLRAVDMMGIDSARAWGVSTLNELRSFLNLKRLESFEEWNPDPDIAAAARALYGHVDKLELLPGMLAEQAKPSMRGSGLCPGHTIGRCILSDAASLIRGDRFLTTDLSSKALTSWGYDYAMTPLKNSTGLVAKLFMNTLPQHSQANSIYTQYPFHVPSKSFKIMADKGTAQQYSYGRPEPAPRVQVAKDPSAIASVLSDPQRFKPMTRTVPGLHGDIPHLVMAEASDARLSPMAAAFSEAVASEASSYLETRTVNLIGTGRHTLYGRNESLLDVLAVTGPALTYVAAELLGLPVRGSHIPAGMVNRAPSETELFSGCIDTYGRIQASHGLSPGQVELFSAAKSVAMHTVISARIFSVATPGISQLLPLMEIGAGLLGADAHLFNPAHMARKLIGALLASGMSHDAAAHQLHALLLTIVGAGSLAAALVLDFYLEEENSRHLTRLHELAVSPWDAGLKREFTGYLLEALRLSPVQATMPLVATEAAGLNDGNLRLRFDRGDVLLLPLSQVGQDEGIDVQPRRAIDSYRLCGLGANALVPMTILPALLKPIFALKGLRRAPGSTGRFPSSTTEQGARTYFHGGKPSAVPQSLHVLYATDATPRLHGNGRVV